MSATAALRLKRGSTTMTLAPLRIFASITHLKPTGCASAGLPPMISTTLAFLMSTQLLVIAPRPKVGARAETVGAWQTRAWLSVPRMPSARVKRWSSEPVSLLAAEEQSMPVLSQRLTVVPLAFFSMKLASRSSFIRRAMRSMAWSQLMRCHLSEPGARYSGNSRRCSLCT
ncbi:hypothetical protein D3C84_563250 [compost metagenome]